MVLASNDIERHHVSDSAKRPIFIKDASLECLEFSPRSEVLFEIAGETEVSDP